MGRLVLTRRVGEKLRIGADVLVTVAGIDRGQVRLWIEAPKTIRIMRTELPTHRDDPADERTA